MRPMRPPPKMIQLFETLIKIFFEDGNTTMLQYNRNTTVGDFLKQLNSKKIEESQYSDTIKSYFGLAVTHNSGKEPIPKLKRLHILNDTDYIIRIGQLAYAPRLRLHYRMVYPPSDIKSLYRHNKFAFEYLYKQSCNDLKFERFNPELDFETALKLCALTIIEHIYAHHSDAHSARKNPKNFLKLIKDRIPASNTSYPRQWLKKRKTKKVRKQYVFQKVHVRLKKIFEEFDQEVQKSKSLTNLDRYSSNSFHMFVPDLKSSPVDYVKLVFLEYLALLPCYGNSKPPIRG